VQLSFDWFAPAPFCGKCYMSIYVATFFFYETSCQMHGHMNTEEKH